MAGSHAESHRYHVWIEEVPAQLVQEPRRETRLQPIALAHMASDQVMLRSWCAKTIGRELSRGDSVLCPYDLTHGPSRERSRRHLPKDPLTMWPSVFNSLVLLYFGC